MKEERKIKVDFNIVGLLGIAFIVLKLCGVIEWPWIWVVAPFWIPLSIGILLIVILAIFKVWDR